MSFCWTWGHCSPSHTHNPELACPHHLCTSCSPCQAFGTTSTSVMLLQSHQGTSTFYPREGDLRWKGAITWLRPRPDSLASWSIISTPVSTSGLSAGFSPGETLTPVHEETQHGCYRNDSNNKHGEEPTCPSRTKGTNHDLFQYFICRETKHSDRYVPAAVQYKGKKIRQGIQSPAAGPGLVFPS